MKSPRRTLALLFLAFTAAASAADYRVIARYPLPGDGTYDYVRADSAARILYVAHATRFEVLNLDSGKKIGELSPCNGAHGVALVPALGRGFTSNGLDRTVTMFDLKTLATLKVIKYTGVKPDAIEYDPESNRIYVVNGGATGDITVIDPATGAITGTIMIGGGKLEQLVFDGHGRGFVNDEEKSVVHVFDTKTLTTVAQWSLAPAEGPTGIALDNVHHRLFAGCGNEKLAVLDSDTGKLVTTVTIGSEPDGTFYQPATGLIYSSNRDGTFNVIRQETPNTYAVIQTLATAYGCRTLAVDEKTGRIFMPTAKFGPAPAPTKEVPEPRPPVLPGTFEIVVVGK